MAESKIPKSLASEVENRGQTTVILNETASNFTQHTIDVTPYKYLLLTMSWYGGIISTILLPTQIIQSNANSYRLSGYLDRTDRIIEVVISLSKTSALPALILNTGNLSADGIEARIYGIK